ncbi:unnamed protein product [Arabidopsis thaliana]|jgi:dihydroneopterin aldolase|uniref:RING-type E3 ubiquitin transferase n=1 Tax=Arabidopsis thaliana TaxID=3702 RepID=Q9LW05_ARATH|nr:RING/U-box superfamily protein [Arabidopsis thaliana]AEE75721.1 RING/U-box superfamily protein [Arabidopsis thaliana]BAB02305.1 unnamed protein product [Arabidopsis thaliana]|eukprot:NP_188195.1 RING/U-box superfamily protein [Arabidopsis thaliana]
MAFYVNDNVDNVIDVKRIYNDYDGELRKSQKLFFDFKVHYTRAEEEDDDVEEEEDFPDFDNLQTLTLEQTHEFDRDWLFGGDGDHSLAIVYHILDSLQVPPYSAIVNTLADEIKDLKKDGAKDVERVQVKIGVTVSRFPGEDDHVDVQVQLAVAPANDEAVEMHLETLVVENEGYCVICMDNIRVGSDVEAGRMPCSHVFHRTCGEEWLRNSGICPVCRALFPA